MCVHLKGAGKKCVLCFKNKVVQQKTSQMVCMFRRVIKGIQIIYVWTRNLSMEKTK